MQSLKYSLLIGKVDLRKHKTSGPCPMFKWSAKITNNQVGRFSKTLQGRNKNCPSPIRVILRGNVQAGKGKL